MKFRKRRLPQGFFELQDEYSLARSNDERISCLKGMLTHIPHGDEFNKVRGHVSRRLRDLRRKVIHKREQALKIRKSRGVKFNEDLPTIGLIGPPDSGKSYFINHYCGTSYASTSIPFETKSPVFGVVNFEDVQLQFLEVPSDLEQRYVQLLHKTDLILITGEASRFKELLLKHGINVSSRVISKLPKISELWSWLGLIRVYPKGDNVPILLRKDATVRDYLKIIHSSWIKRFKTALITGSSVKFSNQNVNVNHVLADKDVIEVRITGSG